MPPPHYPNEHAVAADIRSFTEEVCAHKAALKSYLRSSFPGIPDVDDVVQESCFRVWKARMAGPIRSAKSFLFQTARHLAIDTLRKTRTGGAEFHGNLAQLCVLDNGLNPAEALSHHEKTCLLAEALAALPSRCREVVVLCKLKHLSYKEAADRLGIAERTVETQLARGMKLCAEFLRKRGINGFAPS